MIKMDIPTRSKQCMPDVLDLTDKYNCKIGDEAVGETELFKMPACLNTYANVAYDVRGKIQLAGRNDDTGLPGRVEHIDVGFQCCKLHFLHGTTGGAKKGTIIGAYILNYVDGQIYYIPIIYGNSVTNAVFKKDEELPVSADIAWSSRQGEDDSKYTQVYSYTVNNPIPDISIGSIDFVSYKTESAPFLLAVTAQPVETVYIGFFDGSKPINTIYARNPWANDDLIDLTEYYTASLDDDWHMHEGHDLQNVPKGLREFKGVTFDVRGIIQLAAENISLRRTGAVYPESVLGIKVKRYAKAIHFLHSCGWSTEEGKKIGEYIIHYDNKQTESIPLIYGQNIADWWLNHPAQYDENTEIAWQGTNSYCHNMGVDVHLQKYSWHNSLPENRIESVDFISCLETAGPFVIAITVEP